ncbi:hypothetical protein QQ045_022597 [Rhodiola kirilowii]
MRSIRIALQYKLAWRCLGSNSLWGRYMRSKYKEGQAGTHMLNDIKKIIPILRSQAEWKIGQGNSALKSDLQSLLPNAGKEALNNATFDNISDELSWLGSTDGSFSAKEVKNQLHSPQRLDKALSKIWQKWIPPKISVFLWRLKHNALATDDRVQWCGIPLVSKCRCCTSPCVESLNHLFISGETAVWLWNLGHKVFGIERPQSLRQAWIVWF